MSQTLHQELVQLRGRAKAWLEGENPERFSPLYGICSSVKLERPDRALMNDLIDQWPGHSGADSYPVPHPILSPKDAFDESDEHEMWNPEYEYARARWGLLDWLIEQTAPQFPYVVVRDPGTIEEEEIGTFVTFLEAVAFASKNRDGHDVDVMKSQPDGSLTTEF